MSQLKSLVNETHITERERLTNHRRPAAPRALGPQARESELCWGPELRQHGGTHLLIFSQHASLKLSAFLRFSPLAGVYHQRESSAIRTGESALAQKNINMQGQNGRHMVQTLEDMSFLSFAI